MGGDQHHICLLWSNFLLKGVSVLYKCRVLWSLTTSAVKWFGLAIDRENEARTFAEESIKSLLKSHIESMTKLGNKLQNSSLHSHALVIKKK